MAADTVDAAGDQPMTGLDGDQPAEPSAENEDRPEPQQPAGGEENDAEPANGLPVDGPECLAVGVGRQIGGEQPDHRERGDDPAVAAILALAGAQIAFTEECRGGERDENDREADQRRMGEECGKSARADDRQPEIAEGRRNRDES